MSNGLKFRRKTFYLICITLFFFLPFNPALLPADENNVRIKGYVKALVTLTDLTGIDVQFTGSGAKDMPEYEAASINTLRLNLFWQPNKSTTVELAYELVPRIQEADGSESVFAVRSADPLTYRALDFKENVYSANEGSDFRLYHNLDRAFISFSPDFGDVYIGRQAVAFGSARVINSTDILTSFAYTELNKEERTGVDAVRMKIPVGAMSEVDIGAVFGDDFSSRESAAFLRTKIYSFETDISPIAILFKQNLLAGLDIARSVGDAGYWFEGGYTFANVTDDHDPDQDYLRISTGFDYSFTDSIYAYIEYHFNGAGRSGAADYADLLSADNKETAYLEGAVYLFGRHYIAPGFTYSISPLLTFNGGALFNTADGSILLYPNFRYSLSDEALIDAGAFAGFGKGSRIVRNTDTGDTAIFTESEFGLYPDTYFISAMLYF